MMSFSGKVVWISGASSGLGAGLAREFSRLGATVVLSARRVDRLEEVKASCARPNEHMILPLDASITESHRDAYQEIIDQYGRVDILVANAAIDQRSRAADTPMSVERRIMDVNYFGVLSLIHAVMPDMRTRNEGHIVVISSVMGYVSTPLHSSYAASKHALHGYLEGLRSELYRTRIRFTIVCPGFVRTEISLHALLKDGSEYGRMDATHEKAMTADVFARRAVRAIRRRRNEVLIGGPEIGTVYIRRFFPRLFRFLMPRLYHLVAKGYRPQ